MAVGIDRSPIASSANAIEGENEVAAIEVNDVFKKAGLSRGDVDDVPSLERDGGAWKSGERGAIMNKMVW